MKNWVVRLVLGLAGEFLKAALRRLQSEKVFDKILSIAQKHVVSLEFADLANDDKRKAAIEAVLKELKEVGIAAKNGIVNLAVELAYNGIKGLRGA